MHETLVNYGETFYRDTLFKHGLNTLKNSQKDINAMTEKVHKIFSLRKYGNGIWYKYWCKFNRYQQKVNMGKLYK